MDDRILVVSAHPDDETLGAGGTLLKYKKSGAKTYWINITNMKKEFGFKDSRLKTRKNAIDKVVRKYKFDDYFDLALRPTGLEEYKTRDLVKKMSSILTKIKPSTIIIPSKDDAHTDHRVTFEVSYSASKIFRHPYIKKILMMEVLSETEFTFETSAFQPNYFVNITDYIEDKIGIMKLYKDEIKKHPFPRSEKCMRALATLRGAQAGCESAEGFAALKCIY